jgi:hypothetical protein
LTADEEKTLESLMGATMAEAKLAAVEAYDQGAVDENGNRLTLNKLLNQEKRKR